MEAYYRLTSLPIQTRPTHLALPCLASSCSFFNVFRAGAAVASGVAGAVGFTGIDAFPSFPPTATHPRTHARALSERMEDGRRGEWDLAKQQLRYYSEKQKMAARGGRNFAMTIYAPFSAFLPISLLRLRIFSSLSAFVMPFLR